MARIVLSVLICWVDQVAAHPMLSVTSMLAIQVSHLARQTQKRTGAAIIFGISCERN